MLLITELTHLITIYNFKTPSWLYPAQSAQQPSQSSQEKLELANSFTSGLQPLLCPNCIYPSELLELQEAQDSVREEIMSLGKSYRSDLAGNNWAAWIIRVLAHEMSAGLAGTLGPVLGQLSPLLPFKCYHNNSCKFLNWKKIISSA